jgi:hypothetical protein
VNDPAFQGRIMLLQPVYFFFIQFYGFKINARDLQQVFGKRSPSGTHFEQLLKRHFMKGRNYLLTDNFILQEMLSKGLFERVHDAKVINASG